MITLLNINSLKEIPGTKDEKKSYQDKRSWREPKKSSIRWHRLTGHEYDKLPKAA